MIIRGSQDVRLGKIAEDQLKFIPTSEKFVLEGAGHAAYMTHTADFHRLLYNFLLSVSSIRTKALKEPRNHWIEEEVFLLLYFFLSWIMLRKLLVLETFKKKKKKKRRKKNKTYAQKLQ